MVFPPKSQCSTHPFPRPHCPRAAGAPASLRERSSQTPGGRGTPQTPHGSWARWTSIFHGDREGEPISTGLDSHVIAQVAVAWHRKCSKAMQSPGVTAVHILCRQFFHQDFCLAAAAKNCPKFPCLQLPQPFFCTSVDMKTSKAKFVLSNDAYSLAKTRVCETLCKGCMYSSPG